VLFKRGFLDALTAGDADLAFRRWDRARVKVGSRLRTSHGVLEVLEVEGTPMSKISARDAKRAGFDTRAQLIELLKNRRSGRVFRVRLRLAGEDPRKALRKRSRLSKSELAELANRLDRLDRASRHGPWTARVLRLIEERPGVRAGDLASKLGRERLAFKRDVRKLKELGLTESLEVGYRLSPRGRALLRRRG
jgi:hypothetical protein